MLEFADQQFNLSLVQIGGMSKRQHLESLEKQTGKDMSGSYNAECPYVLEYVWAWWHDLHAGAKETGIDYMHVLAWSILNSVTLSRFDLSAIMQVDRVFLSIVADQQKASSNG